jgi:hypothetical protein
MNLPDELVSAFKQRRGGLFIGAGLSVESGLPTWKKMLEEMIARARKQSYLDKELLDDCEKGLGSPTKYLMIASALRDMMGGDFEKYVDERFANTAVLPNDIHRTLLELQWQFAVTTNYDRLIERAFNERHGGKETLDPITFVNPGGAASSLFRQRPFVLKVHGDAVTDPKEIILSERDYRNVIHQQAGLQSLLQTLFTTYTILFVGASLTDPDLMLLLGYVHSAFHGRTPNHYAIVSQEERTKVDARSFQRDFNIQLLTYDPAKRKESIIEILEQLRKASA